MPPLAARKEGTALCVCVDLPFVSPFHLVLVSVAGSGTAYVSSSALIPVEGVRVAVYLTETLSAAQITNLHYSQHQTGEEDAVTQLQQHTFYGRPDWRALFAGLLEYGSCGVFTCGTLLLLG